jgi:uncharacterized protein Usg
MQLLTPVLPTRSRFLMLWEHALYGPVRTAGTGADQLLRRPESRRITGFSKFSKL